MLPETLDQCYKHGEKLQAVKKAHEHALAYKDDPTGLWRDEVSVAVAGCSTIYGVTNVYGQVLNLPIWSFLFYGASCLAAFVLTLNLAQLAIKFLFRNHPTWHVKFEQKLIEYDPVALIAMSNLQALASTKGGIDEPDFNNWFKIERDTLNAYMVELRTSGKNISLSQKGPFLTKSYEIKKP